jgi:hypothetical protein
MKELFPDIDLNSIRGNDKQWMTKTKPIVIKKLF